MSEHGLFVRITRSKWSYVLLSGIFVFLCLFPSQTHAFAVEELFRQTKETITPHPYMEPDSSGAFNYAIPIAVPPGRSGLQPDLKITYTSTDKKPDSLVGLGWSLNIPYIERLNKIGSDKLFNQEPDQTFFTSSLSGELMPLGTTTIPKYSFLGSLITADPLTEIDLASSTSLLDEIGTGTPLDALAPLGNTASSGEATVELASTTQSLTDIGTSTQAETSAPASDTSSPFVAAIASIAANPIVDAVLSLAAGSMPADQQTDQPHQYTKKDLVRPDGGVTAGIGAELVDSRLPNAKTFFYGFNKAGQPDIRTRFYSRIVHYRNPKTNELLDIDARFATTSDGFAMTKSIYQAALDTTGNKHLITVAHDGMTFTVDPLDNTATKSHGNGAMKQGGEQRTITYPDLLGAGTDLEVTALSDRLVKEVVLNNAALLAHAKGDYVEIPFLIASPDTLTLTADGKTLTPENPLTSSSTATMTDANGGETSILPPIAIAMGETASSAPQRIPIDIVYTETASGIVMTKRIPVAFLKSAAYPIRTDATFDFSPNPHTETTSVDGQLQNYASGNWSTNHDATDGTLTTDSDPYLQIFSSYRAATSKYLLYRSATLFDTSAIPDSDTIISATAYLYVFSPRYDTSNDGYDYITLVQSSPATTTSLSNADFDQIGAVTNPTEGIDSGSRQDITSIPLNQYTAFPLNATGLSWINKSGITKLGWREGHDATNNVISAGENDTGVLAASADTAGTSQDPYLEVVTTSYLGAPTDLRVESLTNPTNVATASPRFSAIYQTASSTSNVTTYEIQVTASSTSWASPLWDSGQQTLSSSTAPGTRTPDITYGGTPLSFDRSKYYWRIKFWDQNNNESDWSVTGDYFLMTGDTDYGAKVESGDFIRYQHLVDDTWVAYDKRGFRYTFGATTSSRVSDQTATSSPQTSRWMLDSITDPNGNTVTYTYATDSAQVYPYKINYGGTSTSTGPMEVEFVRTPRTDIATTSNMGFAVVTKQRISEILVRAGGALVHRYQLSITAGDNGSRSLLSTIQESAWSPSLGTTTLPAVQFGYSTSTQGWTENTDQNKWVLPSSTFVNSFGDDMGARVFDINGDGLPDLVWKTSSSWSTYLNTGSSWSQNYSYSSPQPFDGPDSGLRLGDINGDGNLDEVRSQITGSEGCYSYNENPVTNSVYFKYGSGWSSSSQWVPPVPFIKSIAYSCDGSAGVHTYDWGARLVDINGDGLADLATSQNVYINNGEQFISDSAWTLPTYTTVYSDPLHDAGARFVDVNGDGLPDLVVSRTEIDQSTTKALYLNTGHGWQLTNWSIPFGVFTTPYSYGDQGGRLVDVNGDGLPDVVANNSAVYLNTGNGWSSVASTFPTSIVYASGVGYTQDLGIVIDDINGDGLVDVIKNYFNSNNQREQHVWLKNSGRGDFLTSVTNEKGAKTTITYKRTTQDGVGSNSGLQFGVDVVTSIATDPGFGGAVATTTYTYNGGEYYYPYSNPNPIDRKFAGFGTVIATNPLGFVTKTYYHQGDGSANPGEYGDHVSKIGKPYRIEVYDQNNNLYSQTINQWARSEYDDGRNFVFLARSLTQTYDGNGTHKDKAETFSYDPANGNLIEHDEYGQVTGSNDGTFTDTGSDKRVTTYSYAASSTNATFSLPDRETIFDQASTTIAETRHYYDSQTLGAATKGNETKTESWKSGTSYASSTKAYNSYGLPTSVADPMGNTTTYSYDTYNLYPATTTNALSQTTTATYDYSSGKAATTTDANGRVFVTNYDGLDRPVEEKQPDQTTPSTLVTKTTYAYTDSNSTPSSILKTDYLTSATTTLLYTYLDGFGRTIQTRKQAKGTNTYAAQDTLYNTIGSVDQESLPYFASSSARTTPSTTASLFTRYTYDPQGRVKTIADALGTTTNAYDDWKLTVTDPLGHTKDLLKDAYDNLVEVDEHNGASTYTTTYQWNPLQKLTKLTDALSNIRNFTYDGLGRLLTAEDLHASGDGTYGVTTRTYDDAGNVTQLVNPRNQTINYGYDALNRVTSEDYTGQTGTEVTYTYDSCTDGKGRLCRTVKQGEVTTTYNYNPLGLTTTEAKQIGTTWATTTTSYLRSGIVDTLTYPNSQQVAYVYNDAGDLGSVRSLAPASTTWKQVIQSIDYGPTGQPTFVDYGNNTQTTYTYDAAARYRLTRKLTTGSSTVPGVPEFLFLADSTSTDQTADFLAMPGDAAPSPEMAQIAGHSATEDLSARTPTTKKFTFTDPGGKETNAYHFYTTPIHYQNPANGQYEDIDSRITSTPGGFTMAKSIYQAAFDVTGSKHLVSVTAGGIDLTIDAPTGDKQSRIHAKSHDGAEPLSDHKVRYPNLLAQGIDLELTTLDTKLVEDVIVHDASSLPATTGDTLDIPFTLGSAHALTYASGGITLSKGMSITSSSSLRITDEKGNVVATILPPTIRAEGESTASSTEPQEGNATPITITYTRGADGSLTFVKHLPVSFLRSAAYPVRSDATFDFYPNPHAESTSVDGFLQNYASGNWSTNHDATDGTTVNDDNAYLQIFSSYRASTAKYLLYRSATLFDTSAIPDTNTVTSATAYLYDLGNYDTSNDGYDYITLVHASPAYNTALTNADFDQIGAVTNPTEGIDSGSRKDVTSAGLNQYLGFPLNATGISWIDKTGITKLGWREGHDATNHSIPASENDTGMLAASADTSGTSQDPYLEVITVAATGSSTDLQVESKTNPVNISTSSPRFSAIHTNSSSTAMATSYQIQVATSSAFTSLYFDSAKQTLSSSTPVNQRTPQIYTTTFPIDGSTYYWRIKLWDQMDREGDWSSGTDTFTFSNGTALQDLNYTYDALGNILSIVDRSGTDSYASTTYAYDPLYRLMGATTTNSNANYLQTYSYDSLGNLTNRSDVGSYTYAGTGYANPDAATAINGVTLTYDNAGNVTAIGANTYAYDYQNRMTDSAVSGATTHYTYDPSGARVTQAVKQGTSATTTSIYWNKYYETAGATTTLSIFAGDQLVATIEGNGTATTTSIIHTDHLGGTNVVTDSSGNLAQLLTYYPYGTIRQNEQSASTNAQRKYIGQYYDDPTQLSYLNARYYNGANGNFISEDPVFLGDPSQQKLLNPQSLNAYSYAEGNPITKEDPSGKAVYEMSHPVVFAPFATHQYYLVIPDHPADVHIQGVPTGTTAFTIGGFPSGLSWNPRTWGGGDIVVNYGYKGHSTTDWDATTKGTARSGSIQIDYAKAGYKSEADLINAMGATANAYSGSHTYFPLGNVPETFACNSNCFNAQIANTTGISSQLNNYNPPGWNPGSQTILPTNSGVLSVVDALQKNLTSLKNAILEKVTPSKK